MILDISSEQARKLRAILVDYQSHLATESQRLQRLKLAPNAASLLLERATFIADIVERMTP